MAEALMVVVVVVIVWGQMVEVVDGLVGAGGELVAGRHLVRPIGGPRRRGAARLVIGHAERVRLQGRLPVAPTGGPTCALLLVAVLVLGHHVLLLMLLACPTLGAQDGHLAGGRAASVCLVGGRRQATELHLFVLVAARACACGRLACG